MKALKSRRKLLLGINVAGVTCGLHVLAACQHKNLPWLAPFASLGRSSQALNGWLHRDKGVEPGVFQCE